MAEGPDQDEPVDERAESWPGPTRALLVAAASLGTAVLLGTALLLGSWGFDTRRHLQHEARLRRLLSQQPVIEQVVAGLEAEGSPLIDQADELPALHHLAEVRGGGRSIEIEAKGRHWGRTRVFRAGDMLYFLFFDEADVFRDFVCISR